jgi:hypothetical protein
MSTEADSLEALAIITSLRPSEMDTSALIRAYVTLTDPGPAHRAVASVPEVAKQIKAMAAEIDRRIPKE